MNTAVFPGSFDPFTLGHLNVVQRALPLFDKIIIAIGVNSQKSGMFSPEKRMSWINDVFKKEEKITVERYEGLTVDFCTKINANYILRGLRHAGDYHFESSIAQMNKSLNKKIETIFLITAPEFSAISSTIVRDILKHGGNADQFLPKEVQTDA